MAVWLLCSALLGFQASVSPTISFDDVALVSGISFRHFSPLSPERHIHLYMGAGLGWLDYDRDGWPDLYFCQGTAFPPKCPSDRPSNRLFRNRGQAEFIDITEQAGLVEAEYSLGVASADFDNDGFADIYVSNFGENQFYHNNGDGTFSEVGRERGVNDSRFGSSCCWADIDCDGNLDLYVANYLQIDPKKYPLCKNRDTGKAVNSTCHPHYIPAAYDVVYRNTGDGRFEDFSERAGILKEPARQGLGVMSADLDGDGDADFYVGNDTVPNQLWENQGDGTFRDRGLESGTALNRHGAAEASMGVAIGDIDGDGRFDLFVTNYFNETNTLYRNEGGLQFLDVTEDFGLAAPSRLRLGFGVSLFDPDNNGWLDLFVANGHVQDRLKELGRDDEPFAQLAQLFVNDRGRRFRDESDRAGAHFRQPRVGRGSATADFDRDGRSDIAVLHLNDRPALLKNKSQAGNWLSLNLVGMKSNRDGVGAIVTVRLRERELVRLKHAGASYLSCDEERLLVGIGDAPNADRLTVRWPSGLKEHWDDLLANHVYHLIEGTGKH